MLEILRVNVTECDENQRYMIGGVQQVPLGLWAHAPARITHWPRGTTLKSLHDGATRGAVAALRRGAGAMIEVIDRWGRADAYEAVLVTCQSHLLSTVIDTDESLFAQDTWMALDRTRYMQSAKTFVMVDRAFWRDTDPATGRDVMSMTLTDRQTRGTYLFDNGPDKPSVICLSYSWMTDALKVLPLSVDERVTLALNTLARIYPGVDIRGHIIGEPITVSWEADRNFLGAFKGALPGHYRYNHRMFGHFMQDRLAPAHRGIFLAGDGISWTPAWVEGAVQTALNAVAGIAAQMGAEFDRANPSPVCDYDEWGPVALADGA